ncbi:Potassium transporter KimA [Planctomycetaceae bacterium]|nr:Potassium transporter KimA [Planctomycetaceae bacterium]
MGTQIRHLVLGKPRDLSDKKLLHRISLIAFLAWVGLGADGLSSSAYGPEEAFRTLGEHRFLTFVLALMVAGTVLLISAAYSRVIEAFPQGGGGYLVASALLGPVPGVISGAALLVDYVLTITISIAAAGDALFSFLPLAWLPFKLPAEFALILGMIVLNLRGVKESVIALTPVFIVFVLTHVLLISGGFIVKLDTLPEASAEVSREVSSGLSTLGLGGLALVLLHAFSLGGGTFTGIEAVSNGVPIMREPRVKTARRTMIYMATSLAFTAGGLLVCYFLWDVHPREGMTLNAVLFEQLTAGMPGGAAIFVIVMLSEGALLVVAAQAGFLDGPRVLANMALDKWAPSRFAALSERLTTQNGILLMGIAALIALAYTAGDVRTIVVMYSINVFLTFSLSTLGMTVAELRGRFGKLRLSRLAISGSAFVVCATILGITVAEKLLEGGWLTLAVTGAAVLGCLWVKRRYRKIGVKIAALQSTLDALPKGQDAPPRPLENAAPTAVLLVSGFNGLGVHSVLGALKSFPNHFRNIVFVSVGVVDTAALRDEAALESLKQKSAEALKRYVQLAHGLGIPATTRYAVGTDVAEEASGLCLQVSGEFPLATFFAGQLVFVRETWLERMLHNQTAISVQKRLLLAGKPAVILPVRVT